MGYIHRAVRCRRADRAFAERQWHVSLFRHVAALACLLAGASATHTALSAQAPERPTGSRLLATSHWSYEYIRRLQVRGWLGNLNPLVQPYRRMDVVRGLVALDPDTLNEPVAGWVRLLREEFGGEVDLLVGRANHRWGVVIAGGARASTSKRLDPLRPTGAEDVWPWYNLGGWFETGPLAAELRLLGDNFLANDPDGLDPGQRRGGRSDHAYVAADFSVGAIVLGRFKRNWSPIGTRGLMVSNIATSYPQLGLELRAGRFALRAFTGELDTVLGQKRYIAAHRLDYAAGNLRLSVGESILYASTRGGFQLRYLNPLEFLFFDSENPPDDVTGNVMLDAQAWYQKGTFVLYAEALLDDIDLNPGAADPPSQDPAPARYAFTIGARWTPRAKPLSLSAQYQQVSSFAYRTNRVVDHYSFLQRGLAENFVDYDRLTLAVEIYPPLPGLTLTPIVQLQRQGEGDLRAPFPPYDVFRASTALFLGVRETTYRLGLRGRYQPSRFFWIAWDMGENFVKNARHVSDTDISEFSAVVELGVTIELPIRRRQ